MTAYRRLRGRNWEPKIATFGEMILARRSRALDQAALAVRWGRAVYLGTRWGTAEHFVGDSDGSVRMVRTIRRISEDRRWDAVAVQGVVGVPQEPGRVRAAEVAPAPVEVIPASLQDAPPKRQSRSFHIRSDDLFVHGYTAGCPRCDILRAGLGGGGQQHSVACRERFRQIFEEAGGPRVERQRQRQRAARH